MDSEESTYPRDRRPVRERTELLGPASPVPLTILKRFHLDSTLHTTPDSNLLLPQTPSAN